MDIGSLYQSIRPRYAELRGQTAVVTGSSRGIGKGIALRLAREGMKIALTGLIPEELAATQAEFREIGADVLAVSGDLSRSEDIALLFGEVQATYGGIDLLVNNAAVLTRLKFFEISEAMLDQQIATNIRAPYLCAYYAAEVMRQKRQGNIVHISSVGGLRAHWTGLPYDITKGAIDAMTRAMALELAEYGIRVNAIGPGFIDTRQSPAVGDPEFLQRIPLGRAGDPQDIGAMVAFLASDDASYITGQVYYVDGGITAQLGTREQPI